MSLPPPPADVAHSGTASKAACLPALAVQSRDSLLKDYGETALLLRKLDEEFDNRADLEH